MEYDGKYQSSSVEPGDSSHWLLILFFGVYRKFTIGTLLQLSLEITVGLNLFSYLSNCNLAVAYDKQLSCLCLEMASAVFFSGLYLQF